jgi:hypothetical protein
MTDELLAFYAAPGMMTDPGECGGMLQGLPEDIASLVKVVQGNLIHIFWAERYGRKLSEAEQQTVAVRPLSAKLERMQQVDGRPLSAARPVEQRQVGNCRDFSLLLAGILRHQGRPARARCGFGMYFMPDHFEDHWVCEYWDDRQQRWVLVDAQLDELQQGVLGIGFDPLDVPRDQFIIAGQAWQMCRTGQAKPEQFGIADWHGWWFIWGNVVRELLSLNKLEILPWDHEVGVFTHRLEDPFPEDAQEVAFYDHIAALTSAGDAAFDEIRRLYEQDPRWRVPEDWGNSGNN